MSGAIKNKIFNGAAEIATEFTAHGVEGLRLVELKPIPYAVSRAPRSCWPRQDIRTGSRFGWTARTTAICEDSLVEQAIGGLLGQAGIKVTVNSVPKAVFFPAMDKGDFTMYFAGWGSNSAITTGAPFITARMRRRGSA